MSSSLGSIKSFAVIIFSVTRRKEVGDIDCSFSVSPLKAIFKPGIHQNKIICPIHHQPQPPVKASREILVEASPMARKGP